jgi:hypothetical protein
MEFLMILHINCYLITVYNWICCCFWWVFFFVLLFHLLNEKFFSHSRLFFWRFNVKFSRRGNLTCTSLINCSTFAVANPTSLWRFAVYKSTNTSGQSLDRSVCFVGRFFLVFSVCELIYDYILKFFVVFFIFWVWIKLFESLNSLLNTMLIVGWLVRFGYIFLCGARAAIEEEERETLTLKMLDLYWTKYLQYVWFNLTIFSFNFSGVVWFFFSFRISYSDIFFNVFFFTLLPTKKSSVQQEVWFKMRYVNVARTDRVCNEALRIAVCFVERMEMKWFLL